MDFEKERTVMKSKEAALEAKLSEIEEKSRLRLKLVEEQLQNANESFDVERKNLFNEIERLRIANGELDDEKAKTKSTLENEKLLITNKSRFVEEQFKKGKVDYAELVEKFEFTVRHMVKEREKILQDQEELVNEVARSVKAQC